MPDHEHSGASAEEREGPKPIDGVPTDDGDALTWADGPSFVRVVLIGGALLTGLGILLAMTRPNLVFQLFLIPGGAESALVLFGAALLLNVLRAFVEWRRRKAGRAPLDYGRLALGVAVLVLATSVALFAGLLLWAATLLLAPGRSSDFLTAALNVLVGCFLIRLAGGALRNLLLLVQAARSEP